MTDPFSPVHLTVASDVETIAVALHEETREVLTGKGLRLIMQERLSQVTDHGYTLTSDLAYHGAELAFAGKAFVDTYIDLELRPDLAPASPPDSWPFDNLFWKEPRAEDRVQALAKGIALLWAELDRAVAAVTLDAAIRDAARPLVPLADEPRRPVKPDRWEEDHRMGNILRRCGTCDHVDQLSVHSIRGADRRTLPPCSQCHPEGGSHE